MVNWCLQNKSKPCYNPYSLFPSWHLFFSHALDWHTSTLFSLNSRGIYLLCIITMLVNFLLCFPTSPQSYVATMCFSTLSYVIICHGILSHSLNVMGFSYGILNTLTLSDRKWCVLSVFPPSTRLSSVGLSSLTQWQYDGPCLAQDIMHHWSWPGCLQSGNN